MLQIKNFQKLLFNFLQYTDRCSECETDSDWSGETEPDVSGSGATWRLYNPGTWSARGVIVFVTFCWSLIILNVLLTIVLMVDDNTGSCSGNVLITVALMVDDNTGSYSGEVCFICKFYVRSKLHRKCPWYIDRVPTRTGKPGKMGRHFPVREKSGNFEQTGKVRGNHTKYWKTEIN